MMLTLSEVIGWLGSALYIIAYLLLSLRKLKGDSIVYHVLNMLGATGLIVNALHWKDYPSLSVNIAWFCIGLLALVMILRSRRGREG